MTMLKDIQNSVGSLYFEGDGGYSMVKDSDSDVLLGNNCGGSGGTSKGKIDAHEVFVEMTMSRFLEKYGTVSNYYDSFNSHWSSILTKVEDWYLADLFTCGLPVEIIDKVRIFKPKDLSDACSLASLQVFAYNLMKKKLNESKENEMEESREDNGMGKEIGCLELTDLDENVLHNSSKVCDIKEGATCDDLQSHDEESIENKEVISLVNLGCGKSDVKMDSGGSGNSNFEAKHVKQIVVNSSNRSDKNFNFDKVEINKNEYEDSDIILRDLLLGQIVTDGQEVEKRIDDATFEYDVQQILENIHHNEELLSQQKKLKEVVEQCGMWEWPNMKKASYIKFKFRGKFWKFDRWKWCKRRKVGGAKCECKYKKVNFDIWKWPLRKKDGLEYVVLDGICGALATCKVFIDELDVVGRQRGVGEREQTLQQLLAEMDGFSGNTGVFVLVAANRSDSVLSTGLLRSGGFDKELFMVSFKASVGLKELFDVDENGFTANKSVVTKRSVDKVENYLVSVGNLEELFLGLFESSDGLDTTSVRWPKRQKDRGKKEVMVVWVRMRIASILVDRERECLGLSC